MGQRSENSPITSAFRENESAIKRLLARFHRRPADVDDLAQETFLRAFAAEASQEIASPRAFLFTTARNLAINDAQRAANAKTTSMEDLPSPDVLGSDNEPSADEQVDSRHKLRVLAEAVSALPEKCRRVFILRKIHGYSQRDIAAVLGISEGTVEKHLAAGLVRTAEFLRERGHEVRPKRSASPTLDHPQAKVRSTDG